MPSEAVLRGGIDYRDFIPASQKKPVTAVSIVGPVGLCMMPDF